MDTAFFTLVGCLLLLTASTAAGAQEEAPPLRPGSWTIISGEELRRVPSQTLEQALQGRVPLSSVRSDSTAPGGGMHLRLRSIASTLRSEPPLYIVDGVVMSNATTFKKISELTVLGWPTSPVNRAAELTTHDIEQLEILTGPVALAHYGALGAAGVIRVTTRRGQPGPLQVRISQDVGVSQLSRKLGSRTFETVEDAVASFGEEARTFFVPGQVFDHEGEFAGRLGPSVKTHLQLSGGLARTRYFVSGLFENNADIVADKGQGRQGLTLGLDQEFSRVQLSATVHLLRSRARRGGSPYLDLATTPNFIDLSQREDGTFPLNPFRQSESNPLAHALAFEHEQDVRRVVGSAQLEATLWSTGAHTLSLGLQGGLDRIAQDDTNGYPGLPPESAPAPVDVEGKSSARNLHGQLELRYQLRPASEGLRLATAVGIALDDQRADERITVRSVFGDNPSVGGERQEATQLRGRAVFLRATGLLLEERLVLDASMRAERLNGHSDLQYSTLAAVSYRLQAPVSFIDELVPRLVLGNGAALPLRLLAEPGFSPLGFDPTPEGYRELEAGADLVALQGRARLGARFWMQWARDVAVRAIVSLPETPVLTARGSRMDSQGVEVALELTPLRGGGLQWTSLTLFGLSRTQAGELAGRAPALEGFGPSLGSFRMEEGASVTQIVGNEGLRPDGTCCEERRIGDASPDFRMSFQNELRLGGFSLWALVDWQQGGDAVNLLRVLRDVARNSPDFEPAGRERLERRTSSARVYLEDAGFLKVREVALGYELPQGWYQVIPGVRQVRLSASARNVLTFTRFSGLEPEARVLEDTDQVPLFFAPSRSFWASVDVGF